MPLKKILVRPGVARENTRYLSENVGPTGVNGSYSAGWYDCDKIRFRSGSAEKLGGWAPFSTEYYLGICRSLNNWVTLTGNKLIGVGTNLKFYVNQGGSYYDVTPLRSYTEAPVSLNNPFDTTSGSAIINVNDTAHGLVTGDVATFSGAVAVGGIPAETLNTNHTVTVVGVDDYTITVSINASSTVTGGGGASVSATYTKYNVVLTNPFDTVSGSPIVTVTDASGGFADGDFVTFSGASAVGGLTLNGEYQINATTAGQYSITASSNASSTATGGGTVSAAYQVNIGPAIVVPLTGWGAGAWGTGPWGIGGSSTDSLRIWSQSNFGEDLVFAPRGGGLYYWDASAGITANRGVNVATLPGASDVPTKVNITYVSDISRFVFCFGCTDLGSSIIDPMLIRWSDQESVVDWTPLPTNQSGSLRLSQGSQIVSVIQSRQELLVWTDAALYSLQYLGAPEGWGATLVGENISIAGQKSVSLASGTTYWMGIDKFYKYDGRTQTLRCDLRQYIFSDINTAQMEQVACGTNEGFNEVWWFYCSRDSVVLDRYAIYNYLEDIWYYGNMGRTAWLDSGLQAGPVAATYVNNLVSHEVGNDDNMNGTPAAMESFITSAEFDLDDGHKFSFVWRMLPDVTFRGSDVNSPSIVMSLLPLKNSGSGYTTPASVGGSNSASVTRTVDLPVEEFTGQVYTRIRARQMAMRVSSTGLGVAWQLGAPRLDIRPDGSR
jgi:hypothetical protein